MRTLYAILSSLSVWSWAALSCRVPINPGSFCPGCCLQLPNLQLPNKDTVPNNIAAL